MPIILKTQVFSWHPDFYILFRIIPSFLLKVLTRSFIMISGFDQGASNWKLGIKNYILGIFGQDQNIDRTWILICIYRITDTNAQKWFAVNFIPLIKLKVNIETHLVTFCIFKKF